MMNIIENLQEKSYQTRVRIFWAILVVVSVGLTLLILNSVQNTINNTEGNLVTFQDASRATFESETPFAAVERVEQTDNSLKIYFNINNPTNDILNLPESKGTKLAVGKTTLNPTKITDRQGNAFVKKVLSRTRVFGIMTFTIENASKGSLTFNQMFFETTPSDVFQQKIHLDIEALSKTTNVRN